MIRNTVISITKVELFELCSTFKLWCNRSAGIPSVGIDFKGNKDRPRCKSVPADLSTDDGQKIFWGMVADNRAAWVHFGPPCGTASKARERRLLRADGTPASCDPQPLRSAQYPDGLPTLEGSDSLRVKTANLLYHFVATAIVRLSSMGVFWSVENPTNSLMWSTSFFVHALATTPTEQVQFHNCMHGGERAKKTTLLHHPSLPLQPHSPQHPPHLRASQPLLLASLQAVQRPPRQQRQLRLSL